MFHQFVRAKLIKWQNIYEHSIINCNKQLYLLYYEHLRESPLREIRALLTFLGLEVSHERLACLERHLEGAAKGAQRKLEPYTAKEMASFRRAVNRVNTLITSRGLPPLPHYLRYKT